MKKRFKLLTGIIVFILIALVIINVEYITTKIKSIIIERNIDNFDDSSNAAPSNTYPLLLLHGFNPTYSTRLSEFSFKQMQQTLSTDMGYVNKGILINETTCAELRYSGNPIIIRTSYYDQLSSLTIEDYTKYLKQSIDKILRCTGAQKIDIIAYSMGGIVVRNYLNTYSHDTIRKLIMVATPNHGGLYNVGELADYYVGQGQSKLPFDFAELSEDSHFMKALNLNENVSQNNIQVYTIAGNIDGKGDGLIMFNSVPLIYSNHSLVLCGHIIINNPELCPEAYEVIRTILSD